ncbi:MAG: phosphoglycolate phosphatase 2 [Lysobacteraceae bacterium]|nr:MAG: phosphoglycolate phosphatase 2 [Xanthomonadaceae bacterium]
MISAVLFDLDGTVLDTATDMVAVAKRMQSEHGLTPSPYQKLRNTVSNGARALLSKAFDLPTSDPRMDALAETYLRRYADEIYRDTAYFAGVEQVLRTLSNHDIKIGIVTNKPTGLTESLLQAMGIVDRFEVLVCGDTLPRAKPHADPIVHAMHQLAVTATQTLYVGDSIRDMQAARAAGCGAVAVSWGYIEDDDDIKQWPADFIIDQPQQLLPLLTKAARLVEA